MTEKEESNIKEINENNKQTKKYEPQDNITEENSENKKQEKKNEPEDQTTKKIIDEICKGDNDQNETKNDTIPAVEEETIYKLAIPTISNIDELNKDNGEKNVNQQQKQKISLMSRTKSWMGNIWQSMKKVNVKKLWPKAEFIEYKTADGEIRKIPKKKLNLKKNKANNNSNQIPEDLKDGNYYGIHYHL